MTSHRLFGIVTIALMAAAVMACGTAVPSAEPTFISSMTPSPTPAMSASTSAAPSMPVLPDLTVSLPIGVSVSPTRGVGPREIPLPDPPQGTIGMRFACIGGSGGRLTNASGDLILGVSGCDGDINGVSFASSSADTVLRIGVDRDVAWEIAIFTTE